MNTNIKLPYDIGQELHIIRKIRKHIKDERVLKYSTYNKKVYEMKSIYGYLWIVESKYLKEIEIDNSIFFNSFYGSTVVSIYRVGFKNHFTLFI